jgi:hypothetical protein
LLLNAQKLYPIAWPIARNSYYAALPTKGRRAPYSIIIHQLDRRWRFSATQKNLAFFIVIEILEHDNIRSIISAAMKCDGVKVALYTVNPKKQKKLKIMQLYFINNY